MHEWEIDSLSETKIGSLTPLELTLQIHSQL